MTIENTGPGGVTRRGGATANDPVNEADGGRAYFGIDDSGSTVLVGADGGLSPLYKPGGATFATVGDSHLARGYITSASAESIIASSPIFWANALSGHRLEPAGFFAVGGTTPTTVLTTQVDAAIATGAQVIFLAIGTNSFAVDAQTDPLVIWEQIRTVWTRLTGLGRTVITWTIPPYAVATADSIKAANKNVNHLMRQNIASYPGVVLIDAEAIGVDPTSATWAPRTGYLLPDNTHMTNIYAYWIGKAAAEYINRTFPVRPLLATSIANNNSVANQTTNYDAMRNNVLSTVTGGTASTGVTSGAAPQYFTVRRLSGAAGTTVAITYAARDDGFGNDLVLAVTGDAAAAFDTIIVDYDGPTATVAALQEWFAACQVTVDASPTEFRGAQLQVAITAGGTNVNAYDGIYYSVLADEFKALPEGFTGTLKTPAMAVPSGTVTVFKWRLTLYVGPSASFTVRVGRPTFPKIAA